MPQVAALDVETTTLNKGNPFTRANKLILGGFYDGNEYTYFGPSDREMVQEYIDSVDRLLLFNGKFDLHWLRRIGVDIPIDLRVWDSQIGEFILSNQAWKFPNLDEACEKRGLGRKIDFIKEKYWDNGVDTADIPTDELKAYLAQDLVLHRDLAYAQFDAFQSSEENKRKLNLMKMANADLLILEEMEWNGVKYDTKRSLEKAEELVGQLTEIDRRIIGEHVGVGLNINSSDHKSCLLYGGSIMVEHSVPIGVFKSGARAGQTKYKKMETEYKLPRLIEPLKGSALAKEGYYSTDNTTLTLLRPTGRAKEVVNGLLERAKLEKLRGTYLAGLPKRIENMDWEPDYLFGQYNQCVVVTGRLSSSGPNLQNLDKEAKRLCVSRYD